MNTGPVDSPQRPNGSGIDLGPVLPMVSYHAMERWRPERLRAMALYCSDGRWGEAFDEFCHRHLALPHYDRWAVPGGPAWLAAAEDEPELYHTARTQLDFLVQTHDIERLILITHFGCAWYSQRISGSPTECLATQTEDVEAASALLRGWYPRLRVEAYLAMRQHQWVTFHRLDTGI